jgi:hypothetical protein
MKRSFGLLAVLVVCASPALAAGAPGEDHDVSFQRTKSKTVTATVEAVDQKTRMVTLKKHDGETITFQAGDRVKNLKQVKVGDEVTASYYESVAIFVTKAGAEAPPPDQVSASLARAKPGKKPGGVAEQTVTVTATVEAIAPDKTSVTLKSADGSTTVLPVKNPANLEGVALGDQVTTYTTQSLAISVKAAKKPAKSGSTAPKK